MLDYSNKDNRYLFITKYYRKDGNIEIRYANGDERIVPDNPKNIEIIEERMSEQVMYALENKNNLRYLYLGMGISLSALLIVGNLYLKNVCNEELILFNVITSLSSIGAFAEYCARNKKLKELKKLQYYLENKVKLNKRIKDNNISTGLSKKKQEFIENNEEVFDFSTIDNFTYKDILKIEENIKREKILCFDYNTTSKN